MIIKRNDKNSPVTHEELDENFRELRYGTDLQKITDNGNTTNLSFTANTIIANVINSNSYTTGSNTYTIIKTKTSTTQSSEDVISLASGNALTYVIASNNYTNFWGDPSKAGIPFLKINYDTLIINYEHDFSFSNIITDGEIWNANTLDVFIRQSGTGSGISGGFETDNLGNYASFSGNGGGVSPGRPRTITSTSLDLSDSDYFIVETIVGDNTNGGFNSSRDRSLLSVYYSIDNGINFTKIRDILNKNIWSEDIIEIPLAAKTISTIIKITEADGNNMYFGTFGGSQDPGYWSGYSPTFYGLTYFKIVKDPQKNYTSFSDQQNKYVKVVSSITANSTLAGIRYDGSLWCWGEIFFNNPNANAITGVITTPLNEPTELQNPNKINDTWIDVAAGNNTIYAINVSNYLFSVGLNEYGQLGNETTIKTSQLTQIGNKKWSNVFCRANSVFATDFITSELYSWGENSNAQLGHDDYEPRSSPTLISTKTWSTVLPEKNYVIALDTESKMWGWGNSAVGKFLTISESYPEFNDRYVYDKFTDVVSSNAFSLALSTNSYLFGYGYGGPKEGSFSPVNNQGIIEGMRALFTDRDRARTHIGFFPTIKFKYLSQLKSDIVAYAISTDNKLYAWGNNLYGALGTNDTVHRSSPIQIGNSDWKQVFATEWYSGSLETSEGALAIKTDGSLWAFGTPAYNLTLKANVSGSVHRSSPIQLGTDSDWLKVVTNGRTILGIRNDQTLWGWGRNADGLIKDSMDGDWTKVRPGYGGNFITAIGKDKKLYLAYTLSATATSSFIFGNPYNTQNYYTSFVSTPNNFQHSTFYDENNKFYQLDDKNWSDVSVVKSTKLPVQTPAYIHISAIDENNDLFAWGRNDLGQLGTNDKINRSSPVQIGGDKKWSKVFNGADNVSSAITTTGELFVWGENTNGLLGLGDTIHRSSPSQINSGSGSLFWQDIKTSNTHSLAIKSDGTMWTWGSFYLESVGASSPVIVGGTTNSWLQVSSSSLFSMAIRTDGTLWTWGYNLSGQLGIDDRVSRSSPIQIGTSSWSQVAVGDQTSLAIKSDGTLWTWGNNQTGQLALNNRVHRSSPVQVGTDSWSQVAGGQNSIGHFLAIRSDGALFVWGFNFNGQLGLNDRVHRSSPIQIGTDSWSKITAGDAHSLAIRSNGTLWGWGDNGSAELGFTPSLGRSSPIQIGTSSWSQVSGSQAYNLAIRSDGALFSWGNNFQGRLGTNNTTNRSSPTQIGTSSWSQVSAAQIFGKAIRSDGTLWIWGGNGGLGLNDIIHRSSPTQIGTSSWSQVAGLSAVTPAITYDGILWIWGSNDLGQLGISDRVTRSSPVIIGGFTSYVIPISVSIERYSSPIQVGVESNWNKISVGYYTSYATNSSNYLFSWGLNDRGQLGLNDVLTKSSPTQIGSSNNWTLLDSVDSVVSAANSNIVHSWGQTRNSAGTFTGTARSSPTVINSSASLSNNIIDLSISGEDVFTTFSNNKLHIDDFAIGKVFTQQGDYFFHPKQIGTEKWKDIVISGITRQGGDNRPGAAGIKDDDTLYVWGFNSNGELGLDDRIHRSSPIQLGTVNSYVFIGLSDPPFWQKVAAGAPGISFGIDNDGTLYAWGWNNEGQLGLNDRNHRSSPVQIGTSSWTQIAAGTNSSSQALAILSNGTLWAWGTNTLGMLGLNDQINRSSPVQVGTSSWSQVSAGSLFSMAIKTDGTLWAWGRNGSGHLGLGNTIHRSSPVQVGTSSWSQVSCGSGFTLAIKYDGTLWAWGDNSTIGMLGLNSTFPNHSSPVQVGTSSWLQVSAGSTIYGPAFAIRSDGKLFGWGYNNFYGQLGTNDTQNKSSPTQIGTSSWSQIAAGYQSTVAMKPDGSLWTWGSNIYGELGLSDLIHRSSPVQVGTGSWSQISAYEHNLATQVDGTLWAFGRNYIGQLGTNDIINRSSPVQVGTGVISLSSPVAIGAPQYKHVDRDEHISLAIRYDGSLFTWGRNTSGELGVSDLIHRSSPVQVGTSYWIKGSCGTNYMSAIKSDNTLWTWGSRNNFFNTLGTKPSVFSGSDYVYNNLSSPVQVFGPSMDIPDPIKITDTTWKKISTGANTIIAIDSEDHLYGWGNNSFDQLGIYEILNADRSSPIQIGTSSWSQVSGSQDGGSSDGGQIYAIGSSPSSNLIVWGASSTVHRSSPIQVGTEKWTKIQSKVGGALAIRNDGLLFQWGRYLGFQIQNPNLVGTKSWTSIAVTNDYYPTFAAIDNDSKLFVWGYYGIPSGGSNGFGFSSPVQVGNSSWTSVFAGYRAFYLTSADSKTYYYELDTYAPFYGERLAWRNVGVAWNYIPKFNEAAGAAIANNGLLWVWGGADWGISGLQPPNSVDGIQESTARQFTDKTWSSVETGTSWTNRGGITTDGKLFMWGRNNFGLLGQNSPQDGNHRSSPVQVGTSNWTQLAIGHWHALAIRSDGALFGWGANDDGQLGLNTFTNRYSSPTQIGSSTWSKISVGGFVSAAIRSDSKLFIWGQIRYGGGSLLYRSSPMQIGTSDWIDISVEKGSFGGIKSDGTLWVWGFNGNGELGLNDRIHRSEPVQVGADTNWSYISMGGDNTVIPGSTETRYASAALKTDGKLYVWGNNLNYQLGLGLNDNFNRSSPTLINSTHTPLLSFTSVSSGHGQSYARTNDGHIYAWGSSGASKVYRLVGSYSYQGNFGNKLYSEGSSFFVSGSKIPVIWDPTSIQKNSYVLIDTGTWSKIAYNNYGVHYGIKSDNTLWRWNIPDNYFNFTEQSSPVQIGLDNWMDIDASTSSNNYAAITSSGALYVWGKNGIGQLGIGNTNVQSSPVQVGISSWTQVSFGGANSLFAITTDKRLFSMGGNEFGSLGQNSTNALVNNAYHRSSPVQIGNDSWSDVSTFDHTLAIRSDKTLWAWGYNNNGQLGNNKRDQYSSSDVKSPTLISSDSWKSVLAVKRIEVANTGYTSIGIREDDSVWTWGNNFKGELGNGTFTHRSNPTLLGNFLGVRNPSNVGTTIGNDWKQIAIGPIYDCFLGIDTSNALYYWGDTLILTAPSLMAPLYSFTNVTSTPTPITNQLNSNLVVLPTLGFKHAHVGHSHASAVNLDHSVYIFGLNSFGEMGNNSTSGGSNALDEYYRNTSQSWNQVKSGKNYLAGTNLEGFLYAWGRNDLGQLGISSIDTAHRSSPTQIDVFTGQSGGKKLLVKSFETSNISLFVIDFDGSLYGTAKSLGATNSNVLTKIGTSSWSQISATVDHAAAITSDGRLFAWGKNTHGQVGDGSTLYRSSPVLLSTQTYWKNVYASNEFTVALDNDNNLYTWGRNLNGRLGDGTNISRSQPVSIGKVFGDESTFNSSSFINLSQIQSNTGNTIVVNTSTKIIGTEIGSIHANGTIIQVQNKINPNNYTLTTQPNYPPAPAGNTWYAIDDLSCNVTPVFANNKVMIKLNLLYNIPSYGSEIRVIITKNGSVIEEALGTSSADHPGVWLNISRFFELLPGQNSYGTITGTYIDTVTSNTVTTYGIEVSGTSYTGSFSGYTYEIKSGSTITLMEIAQ